ncbi:peptidase S8/S53 domain-containing protein [Hygrophoropsis aurantiaca]|uniref:Peptidase S8/S53 domain-containing protein n=1 Tax=Hygrophoropsis aurantiaca TaxID=72124 RepID=A0ACB8A329_9AGAM|nr:peptidase S8/S53 domain-containing protein [Hygrophoropsis aurantiaca]
MCPWIFVFALGIGITSGRGTNLPPGIIHEERSEIPSGWTRTRRHTPTAPIPLKIALVQPLNIETFGPYLYDISHPNSPNYSKHWTAEKVGENFASSNETIKAVRTWLVDSGVTPDRVKLSSSKGWLHVQNATVAEVEKLLCAEYHVYLHESGVEHIAAMKYYLPSHLVPHIDFITPTIHFDVPLRSKSEPNIRNVDAEALQARSSWCSEIVPECLRLLYGLPTGVNHAKDNSFGIVAYTPQSFYSQNDFDKFAKEYSPNLVGLSPKQVSIDGGFQQKNQTGFAYDGESSLDLEYAMALVGPKLPVTLYQVGDKYGHANYDNFIDAVDAFYCIFENGDEPNSDGTYPDRRPGGYKGHDCGTAKPTSVISSSYYSVESSYSDLYMNRQCLEYGKLGIMGVTILYLTGDYGVGGLSGVCLAESGKSNRQHKRFNPTFPASCPFVTAVGGTRVVDGNPHEVAWSGSGGGWSNHFPLPAYQSSAVKNYLKHHLHMYPASIWNSTGKSRAYPDISANAFDHWIVYDGKWGTIQGTSASAPVMGAIIALINGARLNAGKRPVGFINPALYSDRFAHAFRDVIHGSNPGCGTRGFNTATGWDPVTGLGTPIFALLEEAWLKLP